MGIMFSKPVYAAKIQCRECPSDGIGDRIVVEEGTWAWICRIHKDDPNKQRIYGHLIPNNDRKARIPHEAMTWATRKEAKAFAEQWNDGPWPICPNGTYKIARVRPRMIRVQKGWELVPNRKPPTGSSST